MSKAHYYYLKVPLRELEQIVKDHQADFDQLVNDTFSEAELQNLEVLLDDIAAIFVQPIFSEMTFDDFYVNESVAESQLSFFESSQSSICLDNIPDFHSNPFQVTYLIELLRNFDEVLIDTGGTNELTYKKAYLEELKIYKNIFSLLPKEEKALEVKTTRPVDPIDFLILDVFKEMDRLELSMMDSAMIDKPEKLLKTFQALRDEKLDASTLLKKSGLNAKDFDDNLEKLKFLLRKL